MGIDRVDPKAYIQKYGDTLKDTKELPSFVKEIKTPSGITLAADEPKKSRSVYYDLEGDIHALNYIDLEKEGLSEYKTYLRENNIIDSKSQDNWYFSSSHESLDTHVLSSNKTSNNTSDFFASSSESTKTAINKFEKEKVGQKIVDRLIEQIFQIVDKDNEGRIATEEAKKTLTRINTRMSKQFDERKVSDYFGNLKSNHLDFEGFRKAFLKISETNALKE